MRPCQVKNKKTRLYKKTQNEEKTHTHTHSKTLALARKHILGNVKYYAPDCRVLLKNILDGGFLFLNSL